MTPVHLLYLADIRFPLERANGIQTIETCHALARRGHRVVLRVRPDTADPPRDPFEFYGLPHHANLQIETVDAPARPAGVRRGVYLATSWLRTVMGPWDVVLTRDLGMAASLARVPRAERPALVYESHGFAPEVSADLTGMMSDAQEPSADKQERLLKRERLVWHRADGYVTITRALAVELVQRFGVRPRLALVPDGVRFDAAPPAHRRVPQNPVVAYAGHLYPWKGVDALLEAIARLPHVTGLIIGGHPGEADLDRCRALAERLDIGDRVTFTGLLPHAEVGPAMAQADIVVLPNLPLQISHAYTSPLKLFEYMASGRPIVASDLPAIREVVDVDCAVLVAPGNPGALAEGIQRLVDDPSLGRRLAEVAARRVRDYTWDARAEKLDDLLRHVVEDRRP